MKKANSTSAQSPTFIPYHLCHAQVLHYLIHPPQPPPPSRSFDTYTGIIPSFHLWVIPIKQNNEFRTISCHTQLRITHNLKSVSSTFFREEDPSVGMLEHVPRQEHSPFRCTTREVNARDLCSMHVDVGCRMSDTSQGRGSCTIRPLHEGQKNVQSSSQVKGWTVMS